MFDPKYNLDISQFSPTDFKINANVTSPALLVINQNYSRHWQAQVNGLDRPVEKVDVNLMGIKLPAGEHQITLKYDFGILKNTGLITLVIFASIFCIWLLIHTTWQITLLSVLALPSLVYYFTSNSHQLRDLSLNNLENEGYIINNIDQYTVRNKPAMTERFLDWKDYHRFIEIVKNQSLPFTFINRRICSQKDYFSAYLFSTPNFDCTIQKNDSSTVFVKPKLRSGTLSKTYNGFEGSAIGWRDLGKNIMREKNGNQYQHLETEKYSATWDIPLDVETEVAIALQVSVLTRCEDGGSISLAFALLDQDELLVTKSYGIRKKQSPEQWMETRWQHQVRPPRQANRLRVYLWNPKQKSVDLDKFSIEVLRHTDDI